MGLSQSLIERIDARLGATAHPHRVFLQGEWLDTGCLAWPLPAPNWPPNPLAEYHAAQERLLILFQESGLSEAYTQAIAGRQGLSYPEIQAIMRRLVEGSLRRGELEPLLARMQELTANCRVSLVHGVPVLEADDPLGRDPRQRVHPLLWEVRALLAGEQATAYLAWTSLTGEPVIPATSEQMAGVAYGCVSGNVVVVAPTADQFAALRAEQTDAANYDLWTEDVIARLQELDNWLGIDIVGAGSDAVQFLLRRVPKGKEAAVLRKWLLEFCPDLYELPRNLGRAPIVLWWD